MKLPRKTGIVVFIFYSAIYACAAATEVTQVETNIQPNKVPSQDAALLTETVFQNEMDDDLEVTPPNDPIFITMDETTVEPTTVESTTFAETTTEQASEGSVRLANGGSTYGRVEIYHAEEWGTVCHDYWGSTDSAVVCRQLGFPDGNHFYRTSAYYGKGTGKIWMDRVGCYGSEDLLSLCPHNGWGSHYCNTDHSEDVGVLCDPGKVTLRLRDGGEAYGRVEVLYGGTWGTVCHDGFGSNEAKVICHQLGFPRTGKHGAIGSAAFGRGSGPLWLDNLGCNGAEDNLGECSHKGWGSYDYCYSPYEASVCCDRGNDVTVRLHDGGEAYGRLEVLYDGTWGTVCYTSKFAKNEAKVVCHQLGFPINGQHGYSSSSEFGQGSGYIWLYDLDCFGGEENIKDCSHKGWGFGNIYCSSHTNEVNVYCDQGSDITVRLSGGGEAFGRVEVLYEDIWGTVCHNSFEKNDAKVICNQLGFPRNGGHGYKGFAAFGHGSGPILLSYLACIGGESNLQYCSHYGWGVISTCTHAYDVSVFCDRDVDLPIRLVGGDEVYGRVEIQYEGIWGTICHDSWGNQDAKVICKQLGFPISGLHGAVGIEHFGQGTGDIWLDDVACNGNEGHIRHCGHAGIGTHNCNHGDDAGVYCDRAIDREVRLADGGVSYGRVEVNYEGIWGTVGDYNWHNVDAKVICRQLGFPSDGMHGATFNANFGEGTGYIWLDNIACDGNELNIRSCNHNGWGIHNYEHNRDAGVYCDPGVDLEVRLVGGGEAYGRVEVNYEEIWGTVCDYGWGQTDAKVVCTQLGFPSEGKHGYSSDAYFGEATGAIWLDYVGCAGNEKNIRSCSHRGWGVYTCTHKDDAGVFCDRGIDVDIRLVDGDECSGRVEINYEGQWGTMCGDNYFSNTDAKVICRQLGFPDGNHIAKYGGYFPRGTGPIWITELGCSGNEDNINDCSFPGWGYTYCSHSNDAGVICERGPTTLPPTTITTKADDSLTIPLATADIPGEAVECKDNHMAVYIPRSIIGGTDGSELYFIDKSCTGTNYNSTHVRIDTELSDCGTVMEVRGMDVVFSNMVHNEGHPDDPGSVISRERSILVPVECYINRKGIASLSFNPDTSNIIYYEEGRGDFSFQLQLYHDETYTSPYEPEEYPVSVKVRDDLYFEADVIAEDGLNVFVDTCVATTTVNPYSSPQYYFLEDGCGKDDTLEFFPSNDPMIQRFQVEAFKFVGTNSTVYVHCFLLVCDMTNSSSRCLQGCIPGRQQRDVDAVRTQRSNTKSYLMSQGPLTFITDGVAIAKDTHSENDVASGHYAGQWNVAIGSIALIVLCATVLAVMKMKRQPKEVIHYKTISATDEE